MEYTDKPEPSKWQNDKGEDVIELRYQSLGLQVAEAAVRNFNQADEVVAHPTNIERTQQ